MKPKAKTANIYEKCFNTIVAKLTATVRSYAKFSNAVRADLVYPAPSTLAMIEQERIKWMDEDGHIAYDFLLSRLLDVFEEKWWIRARHLIENKVDDCVGRSKEALIAQGAGFSQVNPTGGLVAPETNDAYKGCWDSIKRQLIKWLFSTERKKEPGNAILEIIGYMETVSVRHMDADGDINYRSAMREFEAGVKYRWWDNPFLIIWESMKECGIGQDMEDRNDKER